jgi:hypothetical protein
LALFRGDRAGEAGAMESTQSDRIAALTGVGFVLLGIVAFVVAGEPKAADKPAKEIVDFYVDNKDAVEISAFIGIAATTLLVFFGGYLRKILRAAAGEGEILSLVAFSGFLMVAAGFAFDTSVSFALAERADDIDPVAVQSLQALFDFDFFPVFLGVQLFLWGTGLSVIRSGVFPRWLGWVMVVLAVLSVTPIGFISVIGAALLVVALSIVLAVRARTPAMTS